MASSPDAGVFARLRAAVRARVRLHPDWRKIARHAWSVQLAVLGIVLGAAEVGIGILTGSPPIDPVKFAGIAMAVNAASAAVRLLKQVEVSGEAK